MASVVSENSIFMDGSMERHQTGLASRQYNNKEGRDISAYLKEGLQ